MFHRIELLIIFLIVSSFAGLYTFASSKYPEENKNFETALFSGGCFWCMQQAMDQVEGVVETVVGYTGGTTVNPTYEQVSSGVTGHAESVEVHFDPKIVTYKKILDHFWRNIDPTVKDEQFCDKGNQYRAAIFYRTPEQKRLAEESKQALIASKRFENVYTEINEASTFYEAEKYHQNYYKKNPLRYKFYKYLCGREKQLEKVWGKYTQVTSKFGILALRKPRD
jgi:peptide-methionine (S)-S-oxide reductase